VECERFAVYVDAPADLRNHDLSVICAYSRPFAVPWFPLSASINAKHTPSPFDISWQL